MVLTKRKRRPRTTGSVSTPTADQIREVMAYLGSITSERKAESSRANGRLGGRPRLNDNGRQRRRP